MFNIFVIFALISLDSKEKKLRAMEPATKRIKLEKDETIEEAGVGDEQPLETEFLNMNNDCILAICELLNLDDLYSMGSTCVRINELAGDCFQRKFPNESIDIHYKRNRVIVFEHPNKNAQNHFGKYFRSIRVTAGKPIDLLNMFTFIESKCGNELKHLELKYLYGKLEGKHGAMIKAQLANLKSIKINEFHVDGDIYAGILQYCKNIESFSIKTVLVNDTDWMVQSYPMLTNLVITFDDKFHCGEFERSIQEFTNKNPQLQIIECSQVDVIRAVVSSGFRVPCLKLKFETQQDFVSICHDLNVEYVNENIGQLEIFMPEGRMSRCQPIQMRRLADLKPLSVLHNIQLTHENSAISIQQMVNLSCLKLTLYCRGAIMIEFMTMFSKLPKLVELDLNFYSWNAPSFYQLVLPIVQNSAKMTTLKINEPSKWRQTWNLYPVTQLNLARTMVPGAVPLTIHIKVYKKTFQAYTAMLTNIPVGDMVKIHLE